VSVRPNEEEANNGRHEIRITTRSLKSTVFGGGVVVISGICPVLAQECGEAREPCESLTGIVVVPAVVLGGDAAGAMETLCIQGVDE
jgi:hypothetical protein